MIKEIKLNKTAYLHFLLLADESEDMVNRYLNQGRMFILSKNSQDIAEILVTDEGKGILEIKNLSVLKPYQKMGYGRILVNYIETNFRGYKTLRVGTGESPLTLPFYKKLGFKEKYRIKDFFQNNYPYPIIENGFVLKDMVVLEKSINHCG